jgi:nicotinamidase-related amidase
MPIRLEDLLVPRKTALVLCEVQENVIGATAPWPALSEAAAKVNLIANAARIADAARKRGAPVIHCTASFLPDRFGASSNARLFGSAKKQPGGVKVGEDAPSPGVFREGDLVLPRYQGVSPMHGTPLDTILRNEGITTLVLSGVSLSFAMINLTMDAVNRAYQVVIPRDAAAGFPEDYAEAVLANTLNMLATLTTTDALLAAWPES